MNLKKEKKKNLDSLRGQVCKQVCRLANVSSRARLSGRYDPRKKSVYLKIDVADTFKKKTTPGNTLTKTTDKIRRYSALLTQYNL